MDNSVLIAGGEEVGRDERGYKGEIMVIERIQ